MLIGKNRLFILLFTGLLLLVCLAYSNHFGNALHFDDLNTIEKNLSVQSIGNIPNFFTDARTYSTIPFNQVYRPIVSTTFAIDYWIGGGLKPLYFHLSSFIEYLLQGILIFFLFLKIMDLARPHKWNRYLALFAVGWYMLNPANTEVLNYISVRGEILALLGILASLLLYIKKPAWRKWGLYLIPMGLGALAKLSALMFAPILFFYILFFEEDSSKGVLSRALKRSLPALIFGAIVFIFVSVMNSPTVLLSTIPPVHYALTQPFAILHYFFNFFFPANLSADANWPLVTSFLDLRFLTGAAFIILLLLVAFKNSKQKENRPIAFGILWFFLALLPTSSIIPLHEVLNDHRPFFAYVGLVLSIVWWFRQKIISKETVIERRLLIRGSITIALIGVLVFSAIGTHNRNKVWLNNETLWYDVIQKNPQNVRGLMNYGVSQLEKGDYENAKAYFERAYVLDPVFSISSVNLGIVEGLLGNPTVAEKYFQEALVLDESYPEAYYFYARWLNVEGRYTEAIPLLSQAIALSPVYADAHYLLMDIYAKSEQWTELSESVRQALQIIPNDPITLKYGESERNPTSRIEAAAYFLAGKMPAAEDYLNLGLAYYQNRKFNDAILANKLAIQLKPDYSEAYNNLGASYNNLGIWNEAIKALERALEINPDSELARNNLELAKKMRARNF
jgi:tetratricopeptide (TPR) repeat protein